MTEPIAIPMPNGGVRIADVDANEAATLRSEDDFLTEDRIRVIKSEHQGLVVLPTKHFSLPDAIFDVTIAYRVEKRRYESPDDDLWALVSIALITYGAEIAIGAIADTIVRDLRPGGVGVRIRSTPNRAADRTTTIVVAAGEWSPVVAQRILQEADHGG